MVVQNVLEIIIRQQVEEIWEQQKSSELAAINKNDVIAIVLNTCPPRYATQDRGVAFVKAEYLDAQIQADILSKIFEAIEQVKQHPVR